MFNKFYTWLNFRFGDQPQTTETGKSPYRTVKQQILQETKIIILLWRMFMNAMKRMGKWVCKYYHIVLAVILAIPLIILAVGGIQSCRKNNRKEEAENLIKTLPRITSFTVVNKFYVCLLGKIGCAFDPYKMKKGTDEGVKCGIDYITVDAGFDHKECPKDSIPQYNLLLNNGESIIVSEDIYVKHELNSTVYKICDAEKKNCYNNFAQ